MDGSKNLTGITQTRKEVGLSRIPFSGLRRFSVNYLQILEASFCVWGAGGGCVK